jgi:hypothetical protein
VGTVTGAIQANVLRRTTLKYHKRSNFVQSAALAVCDGQKLAGVVTKHGSSYTAHDAQGRLLGTYQSRCEATHAIPSLEGAP